MVARVEAELAREGVLPDATARATRAARIDRLASVRYDGQGLEAELELPVDGLSAEVFEAAHERARGHRLDRPIVITRLAVRGRLATSPRTDRGGPRTSLAPREIGWPRVGSRDVHGDAGRVHRA